jgi:hypothetical protein
MSNFVFKTAVESLTENVDTEIKEEYHSIFKNTNTESPPPPPPPNLSTYPRLKPNPKAHTLKNLTKKSAVSLLEKILTASERL